MTAGLEESSDRQRRGRRIAMSPAEVDAFLREERTCRVGTIGPDGTAHVSPLWFAWHGATLWLHSLIRAQRWTNLVRDPRVTVLVDAGEQYGEKYAGGRFPTDGRHAWLRIVPGKVVSWDFRKAA